MKFRASPRSLTFCITLASRIAVGLHAAPGDLDGAFDPNADSTVYSTSVQLDGKFVVAGAFTSLRPNGAGGATVRNRLARLNADGSLDTAFNPNANGVVSSTAVQADGKIIIAGSFTSLQPNGASATTRNHLARLNSDGSLDTPFNPNVNDLIFCTALQADGRMIIGGVFSALQPNGAASATVRKFVARVNADGTLDGAFDPKSNSTVFCTAVQADGKIIVGGAFSTLQPNGAANPTTRSRLARLNSDGSLDTAFNPNVNEAVYSAALQADGKIIIGGAFSALQPNGAASATTRKSIARLNADGSLDTAFDPSVNSTVNSIAVQADGKIIIGGSFTALQPNGAASATARKGLARLNADGSVDGAFNPSANGEVLSVGLQADGKIVVGGLFTTLQPNGAASPTARNGIARLANDSPLQSLLVTGPTGSSTVRLLRSGALPEAQLVTFEVSANSGASWTGLTAASRIAGGWQATGYALPSASGLIRARVRISSGNYNGSSGLVEVIAAYPAAGIAVEQPANTLLYPVGSTVDYGELPLGTALTKVFTIRNAGSDSLHISSVTREGANAGEFVLDTSNTDGAVGPADLTTFTVTFAPTGASGVRNATLRIVHDAPQTSSPFLIALTGLGLSATASTGNDGLSDHAKYNLRALGFDWQLSQPALVQALYNGANTAGLYTTAQVQALNVGTPLIQKNATSGQFTLTIAVKQSADLKIYTPLSLATGATSINSAGALQFQFNSPAGAAFYRLESH